MEKTIYSCKIIEDWVDYNGHLNDAEYAKIFSLSVDALMNFVGISPSYIEEKAYSMFTLETHICFLREVKLGEKVSVECQILDHDAKRVHIILVMINEAGERVATSEQMLMGIDMKVRRPAPFPNDIVTEIEKIARHQAGMKKPKEAGRKIAIPKK